MLKNAATRALLPCLLGSAIAAGLFACSDGTPTAGTPNGGGGATNGLPGTNGGAPGAPQAAPGLGTNPATVGQGAPPPTGGAGGQVAFTDPNNMPFVDPTSDDAKRSQLFFAGNWAYNGGYMEQSQGARAASLTFRQYSGDQLGSADGVAPGHYRADVTAWVYQNSDQYPNMVGAPLGIIGYAPYFRDATHYLLAVAKPKALEVWAVDGFVPGSEWPLTNRVFKRDLAADLQVGSPVAWSIEIDTAGNSARVWANGEELTAAGPIVHPMLSNAGQHVALISNGNYVHFQDFKLYRL